VQLLSPANRQEFRKRSVDNLQQLYTVVAGLALTNAVGKLVAVPAAVGLGSGAPGLSPYPIEFQPAALPMFATLVVTLIPFYHGANRYLDSAYVFKEESHQSPPLAAMVDFLFFLFQAIIFHAMALVLIQPQWFFWLYIAVLLWDCAWLGFVWFQSPVLFSPIRNWLVLNVIFAALVFVVTDTPLLAAGTGKWVFAAALSTLRTVLDYVLSWSVYWPGPTRADRPNTDKMPASPTDNSGKVAAPADSGGPTGQNQPSTPAPVGPLEGDHRGSR